MPIDRRFAVLIDADNVSDKYVKIILDEVSNEGGQLQAHLRQLTSPNMASWKTFCWTTLITPIQQYSYTTGKMPPTRP